MKKIIALFLSAALIISAFTSALSVTAADNEKPALVLGETDAITVDTENIRYVRGTTTGSEHLVHPDSFSSSYASYNAAVLVTKVFNNWKWISGTDFYSDFAAVGDYVYVAHPYTPESLNIPEISVKTSAGTAVTFKIAMRDDIGDWDAVRVWLSSDGSAWEDGAGVTAYSSKTYNAQNSATEYGKTFTVRSYSVVIGEDGYLKLQLPTGDSVLQALTDKGINSDPYNVFYSAMMVTPFSAVASPAMAAGVSDELTVDTSGGLIDNKTYYRSQITSNATLSDGICAAQVVDNWRWMGGSSAFYDEVASVGSWVYTANKKSPNVIPQVLYHVVDGTNLTFKIAIRKEVADWNDVSVGFSYDGANYYTPSENFLSYTEKIYTYTNCTMSVRSYELLVPANGTLKITLPTAQSIIDKTAEAELNSDSTAFAHASAMVIPASASALSFDYLKAGSADRIPEDVSGFKGSMNTLYGQFSGGTNVDVINLTSGWTWGNANGNPAYLIPELATEKVMRLDSNNAFELTYRVAAGTTLVLPVVMKSVLWDALTEDNNIVFEADDSSGMVQIVPNYVETEAKWSDSNDITIVMRKYSVYCEKNTIVTMRISKEVIDALMPAVYQMNTAATYMTNGSAFVYPAYGLQKLTEDVISDNGVGTSIHTQYWRSNAISSDAYAFSGGVALSKVTTDWLWGSIDTRFFSEVAAADEYVYSTAYDSTIDPEIYYAFTQTSTAAFRVGIVEGVASWDDVKVEYSADGDIWTDAETLYTEDSYHTTWDGGSRPMKVRFYEAHIPAAGYLRITLPNGKQSADDWNTGINTNKQILGYCVFATGVKATDGITGDLNGDGKCDGLDLVALRKILLTGESDAAADVNGDEVVDIKDLIRLKRILAAIG